MLDAPVLLYDIANPQRKGLPKLERLIVNLGREDRVLRNRNVRTHLAAHKALLEVGGGRHKFACRREHEARPTIHGFPIESQGTHAYEPCAARLGVLRESSLREASAKRRRGIIDMKSLVVEVDDDGCTRLSAPKTIKVVKGEGYGKLLPPEAEDGNSLLGQRSLRGSRLHRRPKEASCQIDQHDLAILKQDRLHGNHIIIAHENCHEARTGDAFGKRPEACEQVVQEGQLVCLAHALDSREGQGREDKEVHVALGRYLRVGQHTLAGLIEVTRSAVYLCNANSH